MVANNAQNSLPLVCIALQRVTFVTNDPPPSDLFAGRAVVLPVMVVTLIELIRCQGCIRGNDDIVFRQSQRVTLPTFTVVCVNKAWIVQLRPRFFDPLTYE